MMTTDELDLGWDLTITRMEQRTYGGKWVCGELNDHRFEALVYPEHAENPDYELDQSRISKLWIASKSDKRMVFNFDRGPDVAPANPTVAAIVEFLCEGLADYISA